ncbi:DUF4190 domain-containing protein [Streptomyces liangshanensis]|uniref:DUF4190 domain-containing protein n=1 Tax=Streptomyces liangshanensis TaxID=2717324 RepID=A0A6G9H1T2_9ACTN|nr:DUF4190 domain-containing protein [Streptomyces liangshanensis]QIQ04465.1 DUF4190 domain-containing protein [Streptomyces liangshanensis]
MSRPTPPSPQWPQSTPGAFPGAPGQTPYPASPAPAAAARNGLGVAALVLGILGFLSSPIPFVFWVGAILGLLALIFGLKGRGRVRRAEATNKGVATTGAVLGALALVLSVVGGVLTYKVATEVVKDISASADSAKALAPRDSAVYEDGLTLTVSAPVAYTPGSAATGHKPGDKAYQVTLVLENARKKAFDTGDIGVKAWVGAKDTPAGKIVDGKSGAVGEGFTGTVGPGRTVTVQVAFDTPPAAKTLTVELDPGLTYGRTRWDLPL